MDIHPKFATWLASVNITAPDETLRKWWSGLDGFEATPVNLVSLVQLAKGADTATIISSQFHATLQKQDSALLPNQKELIATLAAARLHSIVGIDSPVGDLAALLCVISFPVFEPQPPNLTDLSLLADVTLADSSRSRSALNALVDRLDRNGPAAPDAQELERIVATTAEETNILWWILGGCSRDSNTSFATFAEDVIPFVAAKELADLTTILPGPVGIPAFADRVCRSDRTKGPSAIDVSAAIKKLPPAFVSSVSSKWTGQTYLTLCRLTAEIVGQTPSWSKPKKLRTVDLALLFYRECLVPRAWKRAL